MSATSTISKLRTESTQLSKALLLALDELERGRDESSVQKRKSVVATILSDAVVEECIVRELHESGRVAKTKSRYSAVTTGIRNYGSMSITDGELTRKSALPSEIAKRRAKGE
jgi:hypothetical protein